MQVNSVILNKVSTLRNLPTLPHILVKLIELCNNEEADLAEISRVVETDPSLSGKILKLINSAYYSLPRKIETIQSSISYLGINTIKNIAIGSSISQAFQPSTVGDLFNLKVFWWHSLRCGVLSRILARETGYKSTEDAFLTGLLHDIGRMVLWVNYPKEYSELLAKYNGRSDLLLAGEIKYGITHCELGAWLLHRWKLQSFMVDAVLYHHESPDKIRSAFALVQIIYLANALSMKPVMELQGISPYQLAKELWGLENSQIDEMLLQADDELSEVAKLLELEIEEPNDCEKPVSEKDLEIQETMKVQAKETSLLLSTLQHLLEAHDEGTILNVVSQGVQILFDLKDIFFFLYDQQKNSLLGKGIKENERSMVIDDLVVPMEGNKGNESLLASCLKQAKPLNYFVPSEGVETTIIDQQIVRFIGKEGMLCLPMLAHGEYVGIIVLGLDKTDFTHLSKKFNLLSLFSKQAALSLHSEQMRRAPLKKVQAERAVASSDIARKVVHEVNNPLSIIKNYLKVLGLKLAKQNIAQDEILILNKEIDRIAHLLRALTSFSENKRRDIAPLDINGVLSDLVKITRESLKKHSGIEVHLDLKYSVPKIVSEEDSIKQVFVNLIKNAAEAMTGGGNLYIKTRYISTQITTAPIPEEGVSQGYVEIMIEDDGPGIPDELKKRLFDPFVSTKGGNHSGLGLSIVHNIVKSLNGSLTCESERGKGTCFKIALPTILKS